MRNKKIISLMLIFCILLTGCRQNKHYEVRQDLSVYFANADDVIVSVRNSLRNHASKIIINYASHGDNMQDIGILVRELMQYALEETDSPSDGDYLFYQYGGYEMHYSYEKQDSDYLYQIEITPDYYTTLKQEQAVSDKIQEILKELDFRKNTSEYEKIRKIYEYVYDTVEYDLIHKKNEHYHLKSTAYGALIYHRAVCQGYAVLMYRLLKESGIDVRVITGTAGLPDGSTEFHAWNIVRIDGLYYNLDVTWNKQMQTEDYFLKSDADFPSHIRDENFADESFYQRYPMSDRNYDDNASSITAII
ncbi:MAG: hypothetical protein IJ644_06325 [Oscillospiraceae bacterium]|nr:hypothetical protein [Oscillospiraceae bacterium]